MMTLVQGYRLTEEVGKALIEAGVVAKDAQVTQVDLTIPAGRDVVTLSVTLLFTAERARQFAKALEQAASVEQP